MAGFVFSERTAREAWQRLITTGRWVVRRLAFRLQTPLLPPEGNIFSWDFSLEICGFLKTKSLSAFTYNERLVDCPDLTAPTALTLSILAEKGQPHEKVQPRRYVWN